MHDEIAESHHDVLHNIESAIITGYERDRSLLDLDVMDLLDAAIRRYASEAQGRVPPSPRLAAKVVPAYVLVERICEWQLGRTPLGGADGTPEVNIPEPLALDELLACLKRLRKSVKFWNDEAGRQGYLDYVSQFIR